MEGFVAPGFERVAEAFQQNFTKDEELGAAFAAVRNGEPIVDIWGELADLKTKAPWTKDTLQLIFSGSKGLLATMMLMLIERGLVDLDAPVSRYWPEFGKDDIRVRHVVSHTAGLPGNDAPLSLADLTNSIGMAAKLAAQPRSDDPRAALCYHALNFGWLCGEIIRRVSGRSAGGFFAEEIAGPLSLDLWIGLPEAQEANSPRCISPPIGASRRSSIRRCGRTIRLSNPFGEILRYGAIPYAGRPRPFRGTVGCFTPSRYPAPPRSAPRGRSPLSTGLWRWEARPCFRNRRSSSGRARSPTGWIRFTAIACARASDFSCRPSCGRWVRLTTRSATPGLAAPAMAPGPACASGFPMR